MLKLTDQEKQEIIRYLETDKELSDCSCSIRILFRLISDTDSDFKSDKTCRLTGIIKRTMIN